MRLTVLGCSGSGPGPDSPGSAYLVQAGDARLVLDLGNGALGALQRELDPFDLDAVLLSHLHADHCADVASLVVYRRYHPRPPYEPREHRLPLYGPANAPERLAAAYAVSAEELADTDLSDVLDFRSLTDGGRADIAGCAAATAKVDHPADAYAVRLEHGGRSLVFSGDTGPCDALVALARDADVFLCEASWPHVTPTWDEPPPGVHLSGRQAGEHASAAGVRRLLITHVPAWFDREELAHEARSVYDGPVELVVAGASYEV